MGAIVTLRDLAYDRLEAKRVLGNVFPYNGFSIAKAHAPWNELKSTTIAAGICYVIGLANDYDKNITRCETQKVLQRKSHIQVGFQKQVDVTDVSAVDVLVNLMELIEVQTAAVVCPSGYQLIGLEAMKDENGLPFRYASWREAGMFEAYFTAHYLSTLSITS